MLSLSGFELYSRWVPLTKLLYRAIQYETELNKYIWLTKMGD